MSVVTRPLAAQAKPFTVLLINLRSIPLEQQSQNFPISFLTCKNNRQNAYNSFPLQQQANHDHYLVFGMQCLIKNLRSRITGFLPSSISGQRDWNISEMLRNYAQLYVLIIVHTLIP